MGNEVYEWYVLFYVSPAIIMRWKRDGNMEKKKRVC
jgi:hypothetical protein